MREFLAEWRPVVDGAIEEVFPREVRPADLEAAYGPATFAYDPGGVQRSVVDPVWELLDRGGKRWRPVLFLTLLEAFGVDPESYLEYATIPELLHTGTILVDDIEDCAELRRGGPAIHHEYGVDVALNAGNALYFLPLRVLADDPGDLSAEQRLRAFEMLGEELARTHLGQGVDIDWHGDPPEAPEEAAYLELCACKTGCLARIVARLAAIVADRPVDDERAVARYAELLSVGFQIHDDVLDVEHTLGKAGDFGKAFGNDVREGKTTLMVIHALSELSSDDADHLRAILADDDPPDEDVLAAVEYLTATGSVEFARDRAAELTADALDALDDVALEPEPAERLRAFATFVVERDA
jgi:geranylgeranyl diphosphate synthase type I